MSLFESILLAHSRTQEKDSSSIQKQQSAAQMTKSTARLNQQRIECHYLQHEYSRITMSVSILCLEQRLNVAVKSDSRGEHVRQAKDSKLSVAMP